MTQYVVKWDGIRNLTEMKTAIVQLQTHLEEVMTHVRENLQWYVRRDQRKILWKEWRRRKRRSRLAER